MDKYQKWITNNGQLPAMVRGGERSSSRRAWKYRWDARSIGVKHTCSLRLHAGGFQRAGAEQGQVPGR